MITIRRTKSSQIEYMMRREFYISEQFSLSKGQFANSEQKNISGWRKVILTVEKMRCGGGALRIRTSQGCTLIILLKIVKFCRWHSVMSIGVTITGLISCWVGLGLAVWVWHHCGCILVPPTRHGEKGQQAAIWLCASNTMEQFSTVCACQTSHSLRSGARRQPDMDLQQTNLFTVLYCTVL